MQVSGALRVSYGGSVVVSEALVSVSDVDTELDELILTVEQQPRHGNVTNDGRMMNDGDQFTVAQMHRHAIRSVQPASLYEYYTILYYTCILSIQSTM